MIKIFKKITFFIVFILALVLLSNQAVFASDLSNTELQDQIAVPTIVETAAETEISTAEEPETEPVTEGASETLEEATTAEGTNTEETDVEEETIATEAETETVAEEETATEEEASTPEENTTPEEAEEPEMLMQEMAVTEPIYEVREIGGQLYIVNVETGEIRKDNAWVELNGNYYFPNSQGVLYRNRGITFGTGNLYYLNNQGMKVIDTVVSYGGKIYLLNEAGKSITPKVGWVDKGDKHYFANEKGEFYQNQWISFGSAIRHYMGTDGAAYTGVKTVGSNLHLFDDVNYQRGVLRRDNAWVSYNNKDYFPNAQGNLYHDQVISFGTGNNYYLNSNGEKLVNQIVKYNKNLYLLDESGKSRKDNAWVSYEGKDYFPNAQGNLYHDQVISFGPKNLFYLGTDGSKFNGTKIVSYNNKVYLFGDNGKPKTPTVGWHDVDGKHYFANEKGEFYQNQWISFGSAIRYYMGADGASFTGVREVGSNLHLFDDTNNQRGVLRKDNAWVSYNGKEYFPNAQGNLYHDRFISFGTTYYYMDSKGIKATTPSKVMGYELTPDSNTGAISQFAYNEYLDYSNGPTKAAKEILYRIGWNLKAAFEYSKKMTYYGNEMRLPSTRDYANFGFANNKGNCYVKAATFYYFAKLMNFDVTQVSGYISNLSTPHSWTVIDHGGVKYVYDPIDGIDSFRTYKISYGQSGTLKYLNGLYMEKV